MGLWLPQGVTVPSGTHKPARRKACDACVGGDFDRKFGRRPRDRKGLFSSVVCALSVSCDSAEVIRLEMLFSMGCFRERGVCPIREYAVPARLLRLSAWATPVPAHRASSIAVPDFAHLYERLGSMRRDHSPTHQRPLGTFDIRTRNFHLINAPILKAHPYPNPSRH
jgi:hypothetical protein